jgi:hypothetical protein
MTSFLSDPVVITANPEQLFAFLGNMNNFRYIMPEQIEDWQSDEESCSFFIKNLGKLGMKKPAFIEPERMQFSSSETSKVKFNLVFHAKNLGPDNLEISFEILSEMNSFVEMMAKRPLTNFVNILTTNLKHFLNG